MAKDFTIIADGLGFPEGPVWMPDGSVIVVEIAAGRVTRIKPDGNKQLVAKTGGGPNGAAIGPDGALYICNNGGIEWLSVDGLMVPGNQPNDYSGGRIERIDLETGKIERLYDACDGRGLSAPNDLVFDSEGGFWFTDIGKTRAHDRDNGMLYYARADGSHIGAVTPPLLGGPNGVALSPDGRRVYVSLTHERNILAFDIVGEGVLRASPIAGLAGDVVGSFPGRMMLDSMAVDANGHICVATMVDLSGIASVDPTTGNWTHTLFPDFFTTNIAFGGADLRDAYITLGATGRLIRTRWPVSGLKLAF
jgi:gluconolactonase